jgi:hypothetical protein
MWYFYFVCVCVWCWIGPSAAARGFNSKQRPPSNRSGGSIHDFRARPWRRRRRPNGSVLSVCGGESNRLSIKRVYVQADPAIGSIVGLRRGGGLGYAGVGPLGFCSSCRLRGRIRLLPARLTGGSLSIRPARRWVQTINQVPCKRVQYLRSLSTRLGPEICHC